MTAEPNTNSANATWDGGMRARVVTRSGTLAVDEPETTGGAGSAPEPTEYLLAGLASCYALALVWTARKRGVEFPDLSVDATGTYEGPRFRHLLLTVTTSLPRTRLDDLLEPALRVCYVSNTITSAPPVEVSVR